MKNLIIILSFILISQLLATIINIPEDFDTIQEGLNYASVGDSILVAEGIYIENLIWPNIEDIKVIGVNRESTIIDGNYVDRVIEFDNDYNIIDENTHVKNFTIRNGFNQYSGAGIYCHNAKPSLINLIIENNESGSEGGGIMCWNYSHIYLNNVIFSNNTAASGGGAFASNFTSNAVLVNCEILSNTSVSGGGIVVGGGSNIYVYNGLFNNNSSEYGGAVFVGDKGSIDLINCTIVENSASELGGAFSSYYGGADLINCILWDNSIPAIDGDLSASYSNIQEGFTGIGNLNLEPQFDYSGYYPFALLNDSPCVNNGTPDTTGLNLPEFDLANNPRIFGNRIDIGAYENQNVIVGVGDKILSIASNLKQNYPNPFNPSTTIQFSLENSSKVDLSIYNIKGQKIKTLVNINNELNTGSHSIVWNGDDDLDKSVSSGIYYYKLNINGKSKVAKKCLLLK